MKTKLLVLLVFLVLCPVASAVPISLFPGIDTYLKRYDDIVIAECVSVPKEPYGFVDGFFPAEVKVLVALEGNRKPGPLKIATIYPMKPGQRYLLTNTGGSAFDTDFLSLGELTVVPVHDDLKKFAGKTTKQRLQMIFSRELYEVERKLAPLLQQKALLTRGAAEGKDDLYESKTAVKIDAIEELTTTSNQSILSLDLDGVPLNWSVQSPGQSGYFYYSDHLESTPDWEFSYWGEDELKSFEGKKLKLRFDGRYTPIRDPDEIRPRGNSLTVKIGDIIFARTVAKPETIYVLKIHKQADEEEELTVKYFVWKE